MSTTVWTGLIAAIHTSRYQTVVSVTGGGSKAISQLLEIPGASQTVLEAVVPYSSAALADWLGGLPDQACSEQTARAMAMASWIQARRLSPETNPYHLVGLSATASLASKGPKRGAHRIHVAVQTATPSSSVSLELTKGERDRKKEEWLAAKLLLVTLGQACEVDAAPASQALQAQLNENERCEHTTQQAEPTWTELLLGRRACATLPASDGPLQVIFPGSFNPPHLGHVQMAKVAAQRTGKDVAYELSFTNVDKRPLDYVEIQQRYGLLQELDSQAVLLLTDAPTFSAKSKLFPGCTFVVGADTISRIADVRYYAGDRAGYESALEQIAGRNCRFLVFGREIEGRFRVLSDLSIPHRLRELCEEVPAEAFQEDISSTALRRQE